MGMTEKSLCDSCTNIGCEFQSGIVRTKCAFYMPPQLEPDNCGNYVVQDSTTKNDIRDNRVKNELNRVKDELEPTTKNCESCRYYGSHHEVCNYCYKCSLWTEQEPTTKKDLAVDCISRQAVLEQAYAYGNGLEPDGYCVNVEDIQALPPVTPQEPKTGHWIEQNDDYYDWYECSECGYGSEGEMQYSSECDVRTNYCPNCGAKMQEDEE